MFKTSISTTLLAIGLSCTPLLAQTDGHWYQDFTSAAAAATAQSKDLLVDFTGSDWCGWCIKLDDEVFSKEAFLEGVKDKYILLALDFPRGKEAKAQVPNPSENQSLKQKYKVRGFPTVFLMTPEGEVYGKTGYRKGGPEAYLEHLEVLAAKKPIVQDEAKPVEASAKVEATPHEIKAANELKKVRDLIGQRAPNDEEGRTRYFSDMHQAMLSFASEWDGTWASLSALSSAAQIEMRIMEKPLEGLAKLRTCFDGLNSKNNTQPSGLRMTPGRTGLDLAKGLIEHDLLDEAKDVLTKVAKGEDRNADRAAGLLDEIPILRSIANGQPLPLIDATTLTGASFRSSDYQGKVLLLDFWATWCGPCRAELPNLVSDYQEFFGQGFEILGISLDRRVSEEEIAEAKAANAKRIPTRMDEETLKKWVNDNNMLWPQIYDGGYWKAEYARKFAVHSIPFTVLVDRKGIIRYKKLRGEKLSAAIKELLAED